MAGKYDSELLSVIKSSGLCGGIRLGKHISPVFGIFGAFNYGS